MALLILGAGYIGARLAQLATQYGRDVILADNWYATDRAQLDGVPARVETADVRRAEDLARLIGGEHFDRVYLLAAQASRPRSLTAPDYTEETGVAGARRVAEAVAASDCSALIYASSLRVYGTSLAGRVRADHPYGSQDDLAHLAKIYAELCLELYARRHGYDLALMRLGIVYGPSPVTHERPESQTVVERFRRLAAAGQQLPLDDGGRATIGVVHVDDATRILLEAPHARGVTRANVAAETVTVADVAAYARGEEPRGGTTHTFDSPFQYRHSLAGYLCHEVGHTERGH